MEKSLITTTRKILSLILKLIVIASAAIGIPMSYHATEDAFMSGHTVFMFFTVQSNILIAVVCLIGGILLIAKARPVNHWFVFKLVATVSITLTGVVFCFVLAPAMQEDAWNVQNILTHVTVPLAAIIDMFVASVDAFIKKVHVLFVTIPPLLYAIYMGIAFVQGWEFAPGYNYPYFFLNWGSPAGALGFSSDLPYMGCVWWILALLLFLILIGLIYRAVINKIHTKLG